jgi:hypothetical protein
MSGLLVFFLLHPLFGILKNCTWTCPLSNEPNRVGFFHALTWDKNILSFWNILPFYNVGWWTKSQNTVFLSVYTIFRTLLNLLLLYVWAVALTFHCNMTSNISFISVPKLHILPYILYLQVALITLFGTYVTLKCIQTECMYLSLNYNDIFGFYLKSLS